jgi:hypothetical protein
MTKHIDWEDPEIAADFRMRVKRGDTLNALRAHFQVCRATIINAKRKLGMNIKLLSESKRPRPAIKPLGGKNYRPRRMKAEPKWDFSRDNLNV